MAHDVTSTEPHPGEPRGGFFAWWHGIPLYQRILGGLVLGLLVGAAVRYFASPAQAGEFGRALEEPSKLIIRLLGALAPTLILTAILNALLTTEMRGRAAGRLGGLLVVNTLVAITIGLLVANVVRPGQLSKLTPPPNKNVPPKAQNAEDQRVVDTVHKYGYKPAVENKGVHQFLDNVPETVLKPLVESTKTVGVILVGVAFGLALRSSRRRRINTVEDLLAVAFDAQLTVLHWVIQIVPIGVFGVVGGIVAREGFGPFGALAGFILAVLLALALQAAYYLLRVRFGSWVRPMQLLQGTRDALVMAFSTASSTATMPVTYQCLRDKVGLREESASMGSLVGANFNNDGTALYEAMSALFIAQLLGMELNLGQQLVVVLTSVVASVGAAGIPEAGLVTMTLVFTAVGLPPQYIPLLLTIDWFLDRCRTAINVMGDTNVSCLLDGKTPHTGAIGPGKGIDPLAVDPVRSPA